MRLRLRIGDQVHQVEIEHLRGAHYRVRLDEGESSRVTVVSRLGSQLVLQIESEIEHLVLSQTDPTRVLWRDAAFEVWIDDPRKTPAAQDRAGTAAGAARVQAQMPGRIVRVLKQPGEHTEAGQGLVVVESMKMQNEIRSPRDAVVTTCHVEEGQSVEAGQLLFELE